MRAILLSMMVPMLVGCVPAQVQGPPIEVTLTAQGRAKPVMSLDPLTVRSFVNVGKARVWIQEVDGVPCTIESPNFRASFQTPARLKVPDYGPGNRGAVVSCRHDSETVRAGITCFETNGAPGRCHYVDPSMIFKHPRNR